MANKILWVEDDHELLDPVMNPLREKGYIIEKRDKASDAIDALERGAYDCVILDMIMPSGSLQNREDYFNGISVLEYMKRDEKNRETPVIVYSLVNEPKKVDEIKALGISAYLNKFETVPSRLVEEVEAAIKKGE